MGAAGRLGTVAAETFRDAGWTVKGLVRPGRVKERYRIPLARPRNVFEIYLELGFDDAYGALWQHFKAEMSADQS